ncbi:hypothetical protein [Fimbriiglobus ruber]|uniref:Metallopeptidase n=1 Tax=Fimbriiglobus ruber TaxID=1908690 RepID=A0A225DX95_9BACT|nr:hypothetical protein [Fimbriiglobus ruber]OWK45623.1 hypothetical protein FRUB_01954 [Fimbriiglobus ruber]
MSARAPVVALAAALVLAVPARAFEPTSTYKKQTLHGYTVMIGAEALKNKRDSDAALRELDVELNRINDNVPPAAVKVLKGVKIWLEWRADDVPKNVIARFFPGDRWVRDHDLNPDKANGIEVANTRLFVSARDNGQPCVMIHELAHGYHFLALQKQTRAIEVAFKQAVDRKLYDDVEHFNGFRGKGYAVTNAHEYFATLSESYFGKSANFPYDRGGLLRYDTAGYWLMRETWGK